MLLKNDFLFIYNFIQFNNIIKPLNKIKNDYKITGCINTSTRRY